MSCNGCRVLRKGCSEDCVLRSCLQWIESPEAQGHATVFVAKFFGRAALMSFVSAVPQDQRPALFESLLYEAAGRTVNPVNGAVGLLSTGNWHVCQEAVKAVLAGASPVNKEDSSSDQDQSKRRRFFVADRGGQHHPTTANSSISKLADLDLSLTPRGNKGSHLVTEKRRLGSPSTNNSEESVTTTCGYQFQQQADEIKLLNLFN